ncbi:unnamed protein product, partial [Larinioides sclopetarius]
GREGCKRDIRICIDHANSLLTKIVGLTNAHCTQHLKGLKNHEIRRIGLSAFF